MLWTRRRHRRRQEELIAAAHMVCQYRNPPHGLWDLLAVAATDRDPDIRWIAYDLVPEAGRHVAAHADRFAAFVARPPAETSAGCVQRIMIALAGTGDPRALRPLGAALERGPLALANDRRHAPALAALPAAALLPAIRTGLRIRPERESHQTAIDVLALWGAEAAPATPELITHLRTPHARDAVRALGRIGPGAAAAADVLADIALGRIHPQDPDGKWPARRWHGVQTAAWAHWRITGDTSLALAVCGAAVEAGPSRPALSLLADLGPAASGHADAVHRLLASPGTWTRVGAAHAWWRITGESAEAVPVLVGALEPARAGHPAFPTREAVRALGAIGAPAAQAGPVLRQLLDEPKRTTGVYAVCRNILEDEALCRALSEALERIDG
ncbi:hypothetical protein [Streptomyces xanthophaeus]|uniref:hypothetical protein n=1 Tax=Streptomyces xanthophaeus TaxID=67385 RepID=UPI003712B453